VFVGHWIERSTREIRREKGDGRRGNVSVSKGGVVTGRGMVAASAPVEEKLGGGARGDGRDIPCRSHLDKPNGGSIASQETDSVEKGPSHRGLHLMTPLRMINGLFS